jgi:hypothetical protein
MIKGARRSAGVSLVRFAAIAAALLLASLAVAKAEAATSQFISFISPGTTGAAADFAAFVS